MVGKLRISDTPKLLYSTVRSRLAACPAPLLYYSTVRIEINSHTVTYFVSFCNHPQSVPDRDAIYTIDHYLAIWLYHFMHCGGGYRKRILVG